MGMTAYDRVLAARDTERMTSMDYIAALFDDFVEMHGDRCFGDDKAIVAGVGLFGGLPVTVVGHEKGRDTGERVRRNFGSAHPEGYRKAMRQFALAEKFHRPVVCFVDTSGAYCGVGAEERGQGQAIARSISLLMGLKTPVISVIIGEGGSGGALALAVADEVWMLENAVYSVLSPEGASSIIWKDTAHAREAAEALRLTAGDLLGLHVIDRVIPETDGPKAVLERVRDALTQALGRLLARDSQSLIEARYQKFRGMGGQTQ